MIFKTSIESLVKIIYCHVLGDYFFSSNYIQTTKYNNVYHLIIHCILYSLPFYFCFDLDWRLGVLTAIHFLIDRGKIMNKVNYVQDQILHYTIAFILYDIY